MKYLVVGCGSMGKRRIGHLKQLSMDDVLCYDIRKDRRTEVEKIFGVKTTVNLDDALHQNPEAIFICVPPASHLPYLKTAIENHYHAFVEKPISHRLEGLDKLIEQSKSYGKIAMASCNMRFHPCIKKIKEIVDEKSIGKVLTGTIDVGEYLPDWHPWEDYKEYYPSSKKMGGGLDAVCDLDWILWMLGDVKIVGCLADKLSSLEIDTDDVIDFVLKLKNGAIISMHTDMIQRQYNRSCKLIGEEGTIVWDGVKDIVKVFRIKNKKTDVFKYGKTREEIEKCYFNETKHFINCIRGKEQILNTLESEKRLLEIVLKGIEGSQKLLLKSM